MWLQKTLYLTVIYRTVLKLHLPECLSICPRPCGLIRTIWISTPGYWSYLFGDQNPGQSVEDILECLSLYLQSKDGFMARKERPKSLRASILGRIPPFGDK